MEDVYKEVHFDRYCMTCKHASTPEKKDPCNECLDYGANIQTSKPVKWEEKE